MKKEKRSAFSYEAVPLERRRFVSFSMMISEKILDILDIHHIGKRDFARSLGKKESQISEWLSGSHNFTIRTLSEISAKYHVDFSDAFKLGDESARVELVNELKPFSNTPETKGGTTIQPLVSMMQIPTKYALGSEKIEYSKSMVSEQQSEYDKPFGVRRGRPSASKKLKIEVSPA